MTATPVSKSVRTVPRWQSWSRTRAIALSTKYVEYGDHVATAPDVGAKVTFTAHQADTK